MCDFSHLYVQRCRLEGSCGVKWVEELEKSNYAVNLHCISIEQDILANVVYVMVLVKVPR